MTSEGLCQSGLKDRVEEFCPFINILQTLKKKVLGEEQVSNNVVKLSWIQEKNPSLLVSDAQCQNRNFLIGKFRVYVTFQIGCSCFYNSFKPHCPNCNNVKKRAPNIT